MTLARGRENLEHMAPEHVSRVIATLNPKLTVLTHFGRGVLKQGPELIAENVAKGSSRVVAAKDGMMIDIDTLEVRFPGVR
jgi:phosphoribosyl 1,2-cyclic phosphodiesterase